MASAPSPLKGVLGTVSTSPSPVQLSFKNTEKHTPRPVPACLPIISLNKDIFPARDITVAVDDTKAADAGGQRHRCLCP